MHLHSVRSSVADGSVVEVMVEGELARGVVRSVTDAGRVTVRLRTGTDVVVDEGGLRRVDATEQAIDKRVREMRGRRLVLRFPFMNRAPPVVGTHPTDQTHRHYRSNVDDP